MQEQRLMKDNLRRSVKLFIPFSRLAIISTINSGSIHYSAVPVPLSANYVALNKCCLSLVYHDNLQLNCRCNSFFFFTDGATKISLELVQTCSWSVPGLIEIWKFWFLCRVENRRTRGEKSSDAEDENQQQTQPTDGVNYGNRSRATYM